MTQKCRTYFSIILGGVLMKECVLKGKDKMSKRNKGFTLAELLIVVAVIAVLVAIIIPIFSSQLEKSRRAVDLSNARNMKSILMNSYASGTITFPVAQEMVDGRDVNTYVAVIVDKNEGKPQYRASGTVKINGKDFNADQGDHYRRVRELFASAGFDNIHVHAKNTSDGGWASYCVLLRSDGTCRILSSEESIGIGGTNGGEFEDKLEELIEKNETNIEKAMNN